MDTTELSKMRVKQVAVTNVLILTAAILFFIVIKIFRFTSADLFLIVGLILLFQGAVGLIKGASTKSFIPIFEKVAIYEKQKMGSEWYKQRKSGYIWNLLLSCLFFLQAYWNRGAAGALQIEATFMIIVLFVLLIMINIHLIVHFRKVDRSVSELDMQGYTWKSNSIALAVGIVFALIMCVITLFYII